MTSWKLWRSLWMPPRRHPVFRRISTRPPPRALIPRWATPALIVVTVLSICAAWQPEIILIGIVIVFATPVLYATLNGTIYGTMWASAVAGAIVRAREQRSYDLLQLSPPGDLGIRWLFCAGTLHSLGRLEGVHTAVRTLLGLTGGVLIVMTMVTGLAATTNISSSTGGFSVDFFLDLLIAYPVLLALYLDHVQSVVLASVTGIFTPGIVSTQHEARIWGAGLFLALQFTTYAVTALALVFGTALPGALHLRQSLVDLMAAVGAVMILFAIRELIITRLWGNVIRQTETNEIPFEMLADLVT